MRLVRSRRRRTANGPLPLPEDRGAWERFGKNFTMGFVGSVLSAVIGLARTGILTKALTVADYGRVLIVLNLVQFSRLVISVRVNDLFVRFLPEYREQGDADALQALFTLGIALCLATGLVVSVGTVTLAPWISRTLYRDETLAPLFIVYAAGGVLLVVQEFAAPILRLENQFSWVVMPQLVGNGVRVVALLVYLALAESYRLEWIVGAFVLGLAVDQLPALWRAASVVRPFLVGWSPARVRSGLAHHWGELKDMLVQTNLTSYLTLTTTPGDRFLLGLLASPEEVAVYGLAQQMVRPIRAMLRTSLGVALAPETVSLWAQRRYRQVERMVRRVLTVGLVVGSIGLAVALPAARWIITWIDKPRYLQSLPILSIVAISIVLGIAFVPFYTVSLCLDMLGRRNLVLIAGTVLVGVVALTGMTALKMAAVQLAGLLLMIVAHDLPALRRIHRLTSCVTGSDPPGREAP